LDGLRVFNITKPSSKKTQLPLESAVKTHFVDGEDFLFELDSFNFWLQVQFRLLLSPATDIIEGTTELRLDKNEKMSDFRNKL
jgi:hypothetical protein